MATQKAIAEHLGISRQLVGFALNNHPGVSPETRERVLQTAKELGYDAFANRDARALISKRYGRRAKTGILGVLLPPIQDAPLRNIPGYSVFLDTIELEAEARGLDVLLCRSRNGQIPRLIQNQFVDGLACISSSPEVMQSLQQYELPAVNLGRRTEGSTWLCPDDADGIRQATRHLIQLGHTQFAYVGHSTRDQNGTVRCNAFKSEMKKARLPVDRALVEATIENQTLEDGVQGMKRLLARDATFQKTGKPSFTALVCYNDLLGAGAVKYLQEVGVRVPDDVSATGFGDTSAQYPLRPQLTTLGFSRKDMAVRAVEMLCASEGPLEPQGIEVPVHLIVRDSCKPAQTKNRSQL